MEGGWISGGLLSELCLLFGLADFKHDWGIPGRQKNSRLELGSQSKITHVFISGRQTAAAQGCLQVSQKIGAAHGERSCKDQFRFALGRKRALKDVGQAGGTSEWETLVEKEAQTEEVLKKNHPHLAPPARHCHLL